MFRWFSAAVAAGLVLTACADSVDPAIPEPHDRSGRLEGTNDASGASDSRSDFLALYGQSLLGGARVEFDYERSIDGEVVLAGTETEITLDDMQVIVGISGLTYWSGNQKVSCSDFDGERQCLAPETVDTYFERSARLHERVTERTAEEGDLVVTEIEGLEVLGVSTRCFEVSSIESVGVGDDRVAVRTESCFDSVGLMLARLSDRQGDGQGIVDSWVATSTAPATLPEFVDVLSRYPLQSVTGSPESGRLPELT